MTVVDSIFVFGFWFLRMACLRLRGYLRSACDPCEKITHCGLLCYTVFSGDAGRMISATSADNPRPSRNVRFIGDENE
jgi:hypothetical protein